MLSHQSFISDWKLFNNILIRLFFFAKAWERLVNSASTWTPHDISMHNLFVCALVSALATMQLHITHTWSIISRPDFKVKVFTRINSNPWFSWRGKLMQTLHILFSLSLHCYMGKKLTNKQSSMRTSVSNCPLDTFKFCPAWSGSSML